MYLYRSLISNVCLIKLTVHRAMCVHKKEMHALFEVIKRGPGGSSYESAMQTLNASLTNFKTFTLYNCKLFLTVFSMRCYVFTKYFMFHI